MHVRSCNGQQRVFEEIDKEAIVDSTSHSFLHHMQVSMELETFGSKRNEGYCTGAVKIIVDYLFLAKDILHVQAETLVENLASQRVLEKAAFNKKAFPYSTLFLALSKICLLGSLSTRSTTMP